MLVIKSQSAWGTTLILNGKRRLTGCGIHGYSPVSTGSSSIAGCFQINIFAQVITCAINYFIIIWDGVNVCWAKPESVMGWGQCVLD